MNTKNKKDKPIKLDMPFDEAMKRLSQVDKKQVEKNIKSSKKETPNEDSIKHPSNICF